MNKLEGKLVADGAKIGIVAARFNEFIVSKLVGGAMDGLIRHDVKEEDITVAWVPGAFEIPVVAKKMAKYEKKLRRAAKDYFGHSVAIAYVRPGVCFEIKNTGEKAQVVADEEKG